MSWTQFHRDLKGYLLETGGNDGMRTILASATLVINVLRILSAAEIVKYNPKWSRLGEFINTYDFATVLSDKSIIEIVNNFPVIASDLEEMGFIEWHYSSSSVASPASRYFVGSKYTVKVPAGKKTLTLCKVTNPDYSDKKHTLWALINPLTGERWNGSIKVSPVGGVERDYLDLFEFAVVTGTKQHVSKFLPVTS
jgi:hypothetical protein